MTLLEVKDLWVNVDGKEILKGLNLTVEEGQIHALMGPNGSGKSTLAFVVAGHPKYTVTRGRIIFKGEDLLNLKPNERAAKGVFLAFQYPVAVPGVTVANFLRHSLKALGREAELKDFRKIVKTRLADLKIEEAFMSRAVNDGFSGGEKKRLEVLQLSILKPRLALLDETDSGLDIDALKVVAGGIEQFARAPGVGMIMITHYQRLLDFVRPHFVHVLVDGAVAASGGPDLVETLEREGYEKFQKTPVKA
ncbi:MAG: Fe-S cluster assembly ATPase SufC [Elusimicrobia bacterium]|nr:Fe-S cluster assembly ATPase SufC [Elusimicrobiota bacterium]